MTSRQPRFTFWLSCHVGYACRHSGACCRAGWPLPVETAAVPGITRALAERRVSTIDGSPIWLRESAEAPDGMAGTFRLVANACVFHVRHATQPPDAALAHTPGAAERHCAVHAALGHDALPSSCRHFPRVCLIDDHGVRVALSHFCPTAATMLVDHPGPISIVPGPPAVPGLDVPEGLDVRGALPPRLSERVLCDLDGLAAWEAHVVQVLAGPQAKAGSPESAVERLRADAARLASWRPGAEPMAEAVRRLGGSTDLASTREAHDDAPAAHRRKGFERARTACRAPWTWPEVRPDLAHVDATWVEPAWMDAAPVVRRYLAAKAFASWMTYQVDAARGLIAWIDLALAVLRIECARACGAAARRLDRALLIEAVRQADLLLVHYADTGALADALATEI